MQIGAIGAAAERADDHATEGDGSARDSDLTGGRALVPDRQLVGFLTAENVKKFDTASVEVGRIEIGQTDRRIDDLAGGVHQILGKCHGAREITHRGIILTRQVRGASEEPLLDLVGVVSACCRGVVIGVDNDVVAIPQVRDRGLILGAVRIRDQLRLPAERSATGIELAYIDIARGSGAAHVVVVVVPGDNEAPGRKRRYVRLVLASVGALVDQEFAAILAAVHVEQLAEHAPSGAILAVGGPDNDGAATRQRRNRRTKTIAAAALGIRSGGVDEESVAEGGGRSCKHPREDTITAPVITA